MKNNKPAISPHILTWKQYNEGKEYKKRIGLYDRVSENERFYRGDQWKGVNSNGLPTPVFNIIGQIVKYLVNAVMSSKISIVYTDENLPYLPSSFEKAKLEKYIDRLNRFIKHRWEKQGMNTVLRQVLLDAAISGDGILYTYWDNGVKTGQIYEGDFKTVPIDNVNIFVADMNRSDIQSQDYIIISGRASVASLIKEAKMWGLSEDDISGIYPDNETTVQSGDYSEFENTDSEALKATYLIKFYRNEEGFVVWEKSTQNVLIAKKVTGMTLYPIAYFNWDKAKNSFHGSSPVTPLIQNQKYINKAYAMVMKHMVDTAFSKVIYDKRLIPEWSNEVGQAIGVMTGGDINNVATTLGVGEMEDYFLDVIADTIKLTKDLCGATEVALGEADPNNTSAIMALREASEQPLDIVKNNLYRCVEELAAIWVEMMCEYYTDGRLLAFESDDGKHVIEKIDFVRLRSEVISVKVDGGPARKFSQVTLLNTLDFLLKEGHIDFVQYLERLPDGILPDKSSLIVEARKKLYGSVTAGGEEK